MRAADKLQADRRRQAQAVDKAVARTSLIQEELQQSDFPTAAGKASYVQSLYHSPDGGEPTSTSLEPATRTLLERVKMRKEKAYNDRVMALEAQRQGLSTEARAVQKAEDALLQGGLARKRATLSEALRNDKRLAAMPVEQVLQEFVDESRAHQTSRTAPKPQTIAARETNAKGLGTEDGHVGQGGTDPEDSEESGTGTDTGTEEGTATERSGSMGGSSLASSQRRARGQQSGEEAREGAGTAAAGQGKSVDMLRRHLHKFKEVQASGPFKATLNKLVSTVKRDLVEQEQELHELKMRQALVQTRLHWAQHRPATYQHELPHTARQRAARQLCRELVLEAVDMAWQQIGLRPTLQQVAAEVHEWKARQLPALMGIARHLADAVLKDVVDELIAEVSQQSSGMQQAADQFAFDILVEAVAYSQGKFDFTHDDVHARLREITKRVEVHLQSALAERHAVDLARTKSRAARSRRFSDDGVPGEGDAGRSSDGRGGRERRLSADAAQGERSGVGREGGASSGQLLSLTAGPADILRQGKTKSSKSLRWATSKSVNKSMKPGLDGGGGPLLPGDEAEGEEPQTYLTAGEAGDPRSGAEDGEDEEEEGHDGSGWQGGVAGEEGRRSEEDPTHQDAFGVLDTTKRLLPQRKLKFGSDVPLDEHGAVDESMIYVADRVFDDERMGKGDKELYVLGLKAMLQEMRKRRGDSPYGHTQALSIAWPRNLHLSRARVLAAQRMKPPLTAGPAVWRVLDDRTKIKFAARPRADHLRAAEIERAFWSKVTFRPFFMGEPKVGPLVYVRDKLAPITCTSVCPRGHFLAVGTAVGALLVFDLRNEPTNPWFEVLGDGELYQGGGMFSKARGAKPPVLSLAWSSDSYQLASLDANTTLRMFWMRPWPGQSISKKEGDGIRRQPALPDVGLSMGPMMMAVSGKAPLQDELHQGDEQQLPTAKQTCITFHRAFNITGTQPALLIPQVTGDMLRIHTSVGDSLLAMPLPRSKVQPKAPLSMQTVNWLMPPQAKNPEVRSQSIYRGHNGLIVYIGFLSDNTTIISVDEYGQVKLWPAQEAGRTGFGWFNARASWALPTQLRTWRAWGPVYPVWPRKPQTVGFTLFGWITTKPVDVSAATFESYAADASLHDDADELQHLEASPTGDFLLEDRSLWLVRYRFEGKDVKKGRAVREEIHRPPIQEDGVVQPLVISTYDYPQGTLIRRSKQNISYTKLDYKVVSACLTPSQRDLLLWCRVAAASRDQDSFPLYSCHVLNLEALKPMTPRIDIYDHSYGQAPPAYAVSPTVGALGSEYLFVAVGCGMVGIYSIATGQLVRELSLNLPLAPYMVSLQLFSISPATHCLNMGKTILAVVPANSMHVHMLEVNNELSNLEVQGQRRAGAAGGGGGGAGGGAGGRPQLKMVQQQQQPADTMQQQQLQQQQQQQQQQSTTALPRLPAL